MYHLSHVKSKTLEVKGLEPNISQKSSFYFSQTHRHLVIVYMHTFICIFYSLLIGLPPKQYVKSQCL